MIPRRRTRAAYATLLRPTRRTAPGAVKYTALDEPADQEKFDSAYTLNLSVARTGYIHRIYQLGFSLEVKEYPQRPATDPHGRFSEQNVAAFRP